MDRSDAAERVVPRWDSTASWSAGSGKQRMLVDGDTAERFPASVASPRRTSSAGVAVVYAAIARLEDEFRNVLSERALDRKVDGLRSVTISVVDDDDSWVPSNNVGNETDIFPADAIGDLHAIASLMAAAGYASECVKAYASARRPAVQAALRRLGVDVQKPSITAVRWLEWDALEAQIRRWTRAARAAVRGVFASERRLCSLLFHDLPLHKHNSTTTAAADVAFAETVSGAAAQLLGFAEAVSVGRRSPEKLFKMIDMHDALAYLLPDISEIFAASEATESVHVQAAETTSSLADAVRGILAEFEGIVLRDPSKTPVPGGTVHPLTRYVMNYNNLICDYKASLSELITSRPSPCSRSRMMIAAEDNDEATPAGPELYLDLPDPGSQFPFASHLVRIVVALERNLEIKASLYNDATLSHLFLMNNVRYIVHKMRDSSELRALVGDEHLKRLTCKFRQEATRYQRSGWFKILNYLRDEGVRVSSGFSSGVSKLVLRERFKGFSVVFGEAHKVQSGWYVPDTRLREELRISISEKLLLAYRPFLGRFRHHIEKGRRSKKSCIKYSVEDLETAVEDFFEGASPSSQALFGKGVLGTKYLGSSTKLN